jgi:hypothetical protein
LQESLRTRSAKLLELTKTRPMKLEMYQDRSVIRQSRDVLMHPKQARTN